MISPWIAAVLAVLLWWASTGAILWRVRRADLGPPGAHLRSVVWALPVLALGLYGLAATAAGQGAFAVILSFLAALAVWGWIELAFLSGIVTGPNRVPCPADATLGARFLRATGTILWHELALLAALGAAWALTLGAPNPVGFLTFAVLFAARISAKLNLFLGVPRINVEFLPAPLAHLPSHFRHARMNWLFPLSVTALTFLAGFWAAEALAAADPAARLGHVLLAVLTGLAVLEHWFMVLPLPDQRLWRWMLPDAAGRPGAVPSQPLPARK